MNIIILLIVVLICIASGVGIYFATQSTPASAPESEQEPESEPEVPATPVQAVEAIKVLAEAAASPAAASLAVVAPVANIAVSAATTEEGIGAIKALAEQAVTPVAGVPEKVEVAVQVAVDSVAPAVPAGAIAQVTVTPAPAPAPVNWAGYEFSTDGRCGPDHGNKACTGTACCSEFGYCGGSTGGNDDWCSKHKGHGGKYNAEEPAPVPVNWAGYEFSTNGRCGPGFGNKACTGKACCSAFGWCGGSTGGSDDWCSKHKGHNGKYNAEKPL